MTQNPYTTIRLWIKEQLANDVDPHTVADAAVDRFMDDEVLVSTIMSTIIRREATNIVRQSGVALQQFDQRHEGVPALIPVPKASTDIVIDMASMKRSDLIEWARTKRDKGDTEYRDAAFLLEIAQTLAPDETVGKRYTVDDLKRIRGRITIQTEARIFIGENSKSFNHILPGK